MNSRNKGKRGELELAEFLRGRGFDARRGVQYAGGHDSPDIVSEALGPFHVECKRTERTDMYGWLAQAQRDCGNKVPVVAHKKNRQEWVAILRLEDLLALIGGNRGGQVIG